MVDAPRDADKKRLTPASRTNAVTWGRREELPAAAGLRPCWHCDACLSIHIQLVGRCCSARTFAATYIGATAVWLPAPAPAFEEGGCRGEP